jgi:hypothetical protein
MNIATAVVRCQATESEYFTLIENTAAKYKLLCKNTHRNKGIVDYCVDKQHGAFHSDVPENQRLKHDATFMYRYALLTVGYDYRGIVITAASPIATDYAAEMCVQMWDLHIFGV